MRQILQSLGSGETELVEVPVPAPIPRHLVVESRASVVSAGTERMLVEFSRANLLEKARQQPERVKQVLDKARTDGLGPTVKAVRSKLQRPIPLGYCNAGVIRETGEDAGGFEVGDRVVTNGSHAEYVRVPWTLAARIPDGVADEAAAFTPLAAIGLQGLRLAEPTLGETVVIYGLGLIGLLTVQLARANGCRVIGIDRVKDRLVLGERFGADVVEAADDADLVEAVLSRTAGVGADMVLLTLASDSSEPAQLAARMSRKRGRLVLIGVTGLDFDRADFYEKELTFQVSCSYGPGRYDPAYEERARDYPFPYVRWTERRNFEAVLELMAEGLVDPLPLVTHRFPFDRAPEAYELLTSLHPGLGVVLEYEAKAAERVSRGRTVHLKAPGEPEVPREPGRGVMGFIGAGNFASRVLIPAFRDAGAVLHTVASSTGTSGAIAGKEHGFRKTTTDPQEVFADPEIDTVVIATRHDTHAEYVLRALESDKHVFVEKPLAIRREEVDRIEDALRDARGILCVGFNRRCAPLTRRAKETLEGRSGPLVVNITVNAGRLPDDHWAKDPTVGGGRLVGEACHFVDLARHFAGRPIVDLKKTSAMDQAGGEIEDVSLLQLAFEDGSVATIQYLANGPGGMSKERVELFWEGKGLRIDNFRRMRRWGVSTRRLWARQDKDKGHAHLVRAFVDAVKETRPGPIPHAEILETASWIARLA